MRTVPHTPTDLPLGPLGIGVASVLMVALLSGEDTRLIDKAGAVLYPFVVRAAAQAGARDGKA